MSIVFTRFGKCAPAARSYGLLASVRIVSIISSMICSANVFCAFHCCTLSFRTNFHSGSVILIYNVTIRFKLNPCANRGVYSITYLTWQFRFGFANCFFIPFLHPFFFYLSIRHGAISRKFQVLSLNLTLSHQNLDNSFEQIYYMIYIYVKLPYRFLLMQRPALV